MSPRRRLGRSARHRAASEEVGGLLDVDLVGDHPDHQIEDLVVAEGHAQASLGYTAHRAVNAVPVVCAAPPGIRTTVDLPQVIATLA
jgi:2,4-diaminopentanoate dehydrogenase